MASKTKDAPPEFDYDYVVLYHPYTLIKPIEVLTTKEELGDVVTKLMSDGTIQYVSVYRDRKVKRGKSKVWVGG